MHKALQPQLSKRHGSLVILKRQCFQNHLQDISSKMHSLDLIIRPTILYGLEIWGPNLVQSELGQDPKSPNPSSQVHHSMQIHNPQPIVQAKFEAHPFRLGVIFHLVSLLHRVWTLGDSTSKRDRYPYLAFCSSKAIKPTCTS